MPSAVAPCERCGAGRVFELQLLPTLIPHLAPDAAEAGDPPQPPTFGTLLVSTCAANCWPSECDGGPPMEEAVQVQADDA